jgi:hypothetical protein
MDSRSELAPVVLFVFNRPDHTRRTLESLSQNALAARSRLFVFSDGPRNAGDGAAVDAVRAIVEANGGFLEVRLEKRETNRGLAASVISGVTQILERYGRAIVVEDDLLFSPHFLQYMNLCLQKYETDQRVFSVGGYSPPLEIPAAYGEESYLSYRCCTWGWATWKDRWDKVDWDVKDFPVFSRDVAAVERFNRGGSDMFEILRLQMQGKVNSWGIRWDYAHYKNEAFCFRPVHSLVTNTGNDGSGVHCVPTDKFDVILDNRSSFRLPAPGTLMPDEDVNAVFATFYDGRQRSPGQLPPVVAPPTLLSSVLSRMTRWIR